MIKPRKRWLTLPEVEVMLGGDPANRDAIVEGCLAGEIKSRVRYERGYRDCEYWMWKNGEIDWDKSTLKFPTMFQPTGGESLTSYSTKEVEIDRESLAKYFEIMADLGQSLRARSKKNVGGRPRKYDWDAFWVELAAHLYCKGVPEKQADLEQHMMQWLMNAWVEEPSLSEVRKRISSLLNEICSRLKT